MRIFLLLVRARRWCKVAYVCARVGWVGLVLVLALGRSRDVCPVGWLLALPSPRKT